MFIWDLSQVLVQVRALFGNAIFVQLMASSSVALESILLFQALHLRLEVLQIAWRFGAFLGQRLEALCMEFFGRLRYLDENFGWWTIGIPPFWIFIIRAIGIWRWSQ